MQPQIIKIVPLKENVQWQCPEGWTIKELQQSVTSKDTAFYVVLMKINQQPEPTVGTIKKPKIATL